jgi:hypothetical protein
LIEGFAAASVARLTVRDGRPLFERNRHRSCFFGHDDPGKPGSRVRAPARAHPACSVARRSIGVARSAGFGERPLCRPSRLFVRRPPLCSGASLPDSASKRRALSAANSHRTDPGRHRHCRLSGARRPALLRHRHAPVGGPAEARQGLRLICFRLNAIGAFQLAASIGSSLMLMPLAAAIAADACMASNSDASAVPAPCGSPPQLLRLVHIRCKQALRASTGRG